MHTVIRFRLRDVREDRGLTQLDLAQRVGVRQATISELETGKAKTLRLSLLDALCNALDAGPSELLDYTPAKKVKR